MRNQGTAWEWRMRYANSGSKVASRGFDRGKFRVAHFALRLRTAAWRVPSAWGGLLRHRCNAHPGLHYLQPRRDDFFAVFKPALYDTFAFENGPCLQGAALDRVVRLHHEGVLHALL